VGWILSYQHCPLKVDTPHPVECWFENNFNPNEKIFWIVFSFCHHYEIRGGVANGNLISFSWVLQLTNDLQSTKLPSNIQNGSFVLFVNSTLSYSCTIFRDCVAYNISYSIKLTPSSMISIVLVALIAINIYYLQIHRLRGGFHRIWNQELMNKELRPPWLATSYSSRVFIREGFHRFLSLLIDLLNKLWYIYTSLCCAQTHWLKFCRMVDILLKADIIPPLAA